MNGEIGAARYLGLWLFGAGFGYLEAAVVVYLREIFNQGSDSIFPVASALASGGNLIVAVEFNRELATLGLMLIPALLFSKRIFFRFLAFTILFGVWDLSYYLFLKLLLGWPGSWLTYDILFLVPTLWVAPVACPILIAGSMVVFASALLWLGGGRVVRPPALMHWAFAAAGAGLVLFSFMADADFYLGGGLPRRFAWEFFTAGYGLAFIGALHYLVAVSRSRARYL